MAEIYEGHVPPPVYIFPRSIDTLLRYDLLLVSPHVYYNNSCLGSYEDTDNTAMPKMASRSTGSELTRLKKIDTRIYIDLWKRSLPAISPNSSNVGNIAFETIRKITICFLKKENDNVYKFYKKKNNEHPHFQNSISQLQIELTVDSKDSGKNVYIDYFRPSGRTASSEGSSSKKLIIPVDEMSSGYFIECTLRILSNEDNIKTADNKKIELKARLVLRVGDIVTYIGNESKLEMTLCRCPQPPSNANADPFEYLKENELSKDIFVMPRQCAEEKHKAYIKKLQLYNNQVLARNKKMTQKNSSEPVKDNRFDFVKEDGIYTSQLGINYGMSVDIFKRTRSREEANRLRTVFPYNFSTFGHGEKFTEFLASNYDLDENIVKKLVIDRNFIYGTNTNQEQMSDIQGLKNLYERVVQVFRQNIIDEANRYVNFGRENLNRRWFARPGRNRNYHRGDFIINNLTKIVFNGSEGNNTVAIVGNQNNVVVQAGSPLPINTIVRFFPGSTEYDASDQYDYDTSNTQHRYRIAGITINGTRIDAPENQQWFIGLNYADKQRCDDRLAVNYCDYVSLPNDINPVDRAALQEYGRTFGVPYYYRPFDDTYGGKHPLVDFDRLELNPTELNQVINWYLYPSGRKTNSPTSPRSNYPEIMGVGLDCSGLIMNLLLDTTHNGNRNGTRFFEDVLQGNETYRSHGETASDMGARRARPIPHDMITNNNTLIQASDLIYQDGHIAICDIGFNAYITTEERDRRDFTIIHNYGGLGVYLSTGAGFWFNGGFFNKTLRGPFYHWRHDYITDNPITIGRLYLWY